MSDKAELRRAYEDMLETMKTPGWALIMEDFERLRRSVADVRACTNLDYAKGQLNILDTLAGWERLTELALQELEATDGHEEGARV